MSYRLKIVLPVFVAIVSGLMALEGGNAVRVLAAPPQVTLSASPSQASVGQQVNFVGQVVSATPGATTVGATINFGDGQSQTPLTTGAGFIAQHSYSAAGTYTAMLSVTDTNGETGTATTTVTVTSGSQAPVVTVSASPNPATVGQAVTFTFSATAGGQVGVQVVPTMLINFGDGAAPLPLNGPTGTINHTYTQSGTFTATVTAQFAGGPIGSAQTTVTVTAGCPAPTVTLSASPTTISVGQSSTFTFSATAGSGPGCNQSTAPLPTMLINFGDGSSPLPLNGVSGSIAHTFNQGGTFTVTVTATSGGQTGQAQTAVQVTAPCGAPTVTVSASPTSATPGQTITITYAAVAGSGCTQSTAPLPTMTINWGDSSGVQSITGPSGTITHTYNQPGNYTVTVSASSAGQTGTGQAAVTIGQAGMPVQVGAGWNLIGGPAGTIITGNSGPLYTFQSGDTSYRSVAAGTPLQAGWGYWAYFPTATTISVPFVTNVQPMTIQTPANQYIMVGNPGNTPATVTGATIVYIFNTSSNSYTASNTIPVGGGAWVLTTNGGPITITN